MPFDGFEQLRAVLAIPSFVSLQELCQEAADEIKRLRAAVQGND